MKIETQFSRILSFVIINHLDFHVERQPVRHPDGWFAVERPCGGTIVLSIGRWDIHLTNARRVDAHFGRTPRTY